MGASTAELVWMAGEDHIRHDPDVPSTRGRSGLWLIGAVTAMQDSAALFGFLRAGAERGERAALATLTAVIGSATRRIGTQLAVRADGATFGSLSGGCLEAAVAAEAQAAMATGRARSVRFGAGSRFIDIRLPCGGGIDLLVSPPMPDRTVDRASALLGRRRPVTLRLSADGHVSAGPSRPGDRTGWSGAHFLVRHEPPLRLVVVGQGAEPAALLRLVRGFGAEAVLVSPDRTCVADAARLGFAAELLDRERWPDLLAADGHTAVVVLFHDHDRETRLLARVLAGDAFFVGAMGSRKIHAERCRRLAQAGVPVDAIARVVGPVGLIEATRDPQSMAVSILAQVIERHEAMLQAGPARRPDACRNLPAEAAVLDPRTARYEVPASC